MNLIVIRHGHAGNASDFAASGLDDDLRPLTEQGRRRMRRNAQGLRQLVGPLERVGHSPLVRAVETAAIVAAAFGAPMAEVPALAPDGDRSAILQWISTFPMTATVALVGHEPRLSELVAWLTLNETTPYFEFKKGGAARVLLRSRIAPGSGQLCWLMEPRQLRQFRH